MKEYQKPEIEKINLEVLEAMTTSGPDSGYEDDFS